MTEESFQQARKIMKSANYVRGQITAAKGDVAKWTKIEAGNRTELRHGQAEGAKKMLAKAIKRFDELKAKFASMAFPEPNIKNVYKQKSQCQNCGTQVAVGNDFCGECLCED